ncbi:MAG: nucleotidyltransferase family protein, partial [Rhodobacteraceae bacterium]|nr:nucleotidyltransferase family protein [Paracoccaceae bacterium]
GQSTRMRGVDKLLQNIDGTPLLRRMAVMACEASDTVLVALPADPHPRWAALNGLNLTCIAVADAAEGMNASLRKGLAALPKDSDAVMVLLADLANLTISDICKVIQAVDTKTNTLIWRGATADGKPGHPVVFHNALLPELRALTGDSGAHSVVRAHVDQLILVPLPEHNARLDLDTPEDWATWCKTQSR